MFRMQYKKLNKKLILTYKTFVPSFAEGKDI